MPNNSFGNLFRITTFGESHGNAIGVIIDGCPAGIVIDLAYIQQIVNERKASNSLYTTKRHESDTVEILSGLYENKTLGTPICLIIYNTNQKSADYFELKNIYRPSHADFTWDKKFNHVDKRGGGRASARETVARVAAAAFAYKILEKFNLNIYSFLAQIGSKAICKDNIDYSAISQNTFFSPDKTIIPIWEKLLQDTLKQQDSIGAIVEVHLKNCPVGLGEPVFNKLNAKLAYAIFTIPAVKGLMFGDAFNLASLKGSEVNDSMFSHHNQIKFKTNHSAGINGGISNGEDIILKIAFKPTSSIALTQDSIDSELNNVKINIKGRHDPCLGIRAVPVCKAMCAITLVDFILLKNINNINNILA